MKRFKNLYREICSWDNLLLAAKLAQKGKRHQPNVAQFNFRLESELLQLEEELQNQSYIPGKYQSFYIYDPKERMISAAPYRDRVVHHVLCNIIQPIFENTFIFDSYANRKGKGTQSHSPLPTLRPKKQIRTQSRYSQILSKHWPRDFEANHPSKNRLPQNLVADRLDNWQQQCTGSTFRLFWRRWFVHTPWTKKRLTDWQFDESVFRQHLFEWIWPLCKGTIER